MDQDLTKIFKSYNWLLKCIKYLNEKNIFLLLLKIDSVLPSLIKKSKNLWEILSKIPEDSNKIRLLKSLRLWYLKNIIKNAKDLWNIFEWLYWKSQWEFIRFLGDDFIKEVFWSTNEIIMILQYLNDENKDKITDILWIKNMKTKVKTANNFLTMFWWLSDNKAKDFINLFSKIEIKNYFKNDEEFYNFMLRLSNSKEKIFLKHILK